MSRTAQRTEKTAKTATIRPLEEADLPAADHIMRLAFGTFLGVPEPLEVFGEIEYVRGRWLADPSAAYAAEVDGEIVGSNFATRWGSFGFFGPTTVHPDFEDRGIGTKLMEPIMECFDTWKVSHTGLFTWPQSPKHIGLYNKFGFWPRFLTAVGSMPVGKPSTRPDWSVYSELAEGERQSCRDACGELTDAIYEGLDLEREITATDVQGLGETVLLRDNSDVVGFAVCHCGKGESGSGVCFIKFGAVRPGPKAPEHFDQLLDACEELAAAKSLPRLDAGVNMARHDAHRKMLDRGFKTWLQGVAMEKPNEPGYNREDVYVIDDWR